MEPTCRCWPSPLSPHQPESCWAPSVWGSPPWPLLPGTVHGVLSPGCGSTKAWVSESKGPEMDSHFRTRATLS